MKKVKEGSSYETGEFGGILHSNEVSLDFKCDLPEKKKFRFLRTQVNQER